MSTLKNLECSVEVAAHALINISNISIFSIPNPYNTVTNPYKILSINISRGWGNLVNPSISLPAKINSSLKKNLFLFSGMKNLSCSPCLYRYLPDILVTKLYRSNSYLKYFKNSNMIRHSQCDLDGCVLIILHNSGFSVSNLIYERCGMFQSCISVNSCSEASTKNILESGFL